MTRAVCRKYVADYPLLRRCYSPFSRCYCSLFLEEKGNEFMLLEGMGTLESLERRGAASTGRRRSPSGPLDRCQALGGLAANPLQMQPAPFLEAQEGGQGKTRGAMPRHINEAGLAMIKSFEGLRLDAYRDPVGIWTIGYGHTRGVQPVGLIALAGQAAFEMADEGRQIAAGPVVFGHAQTPVGRRRRTCSTCICRKFTGGRPSPLPISANGANPV